ncbi:MAG: FeoA family protein [Thermodesulfobacteriota bacterium]
MAVSEKDLKLDAVEPIEHSLAEMPAGKRVRITGYRGGRMLRARLLAMGLNLGRELEVVQNNHGLIIVSIDGGRVALGKGISHKILAEPVLPLLTHQQTG